LSPGSERRQRFDYAGSPAPLAISPAAPRTTLAVYFLVPQPRKTNREIEIKLRVTDPHVAIRAIQALGAVNQGRVFESNTLYDTPHSDLRRRGRLLRVRTESAASGTARIHSASIRRVVLTTKAPSRQRRAPKKRPRYKERAEREVVAGSHPRNWAAVFTRLGFQPQFHYEKYRTSFRLRGLHLDLDETPVGTFLELEGRPSAIDRVACALGYAPSAYIRGTYWDIYAADRRRRGRPIKNMVFPAK
jgi:adenylate cyclase, class 2